ncbi:hypothetical protein Micbo1qcDRAFT_195031 [Microdochium bolleyi]|uniref:Hemerythrin-like domain-containing protein n=1 Tax=Microdochium bolleyi TaxID=196109 RepID=A0A136J4R4_9PEZI|nr:hypothetical protein Micbo1qcDRAFT_195031 [Microdochium bolleyi]
MSDRSSVNSWPSREGLPDKSKNTTSTNSTVSVGSRFAWADEPFALIPTPVTTLNGNVHHPAAHMANESAHLYNAMLRGLNAIYQQAPYINTSAATDVADFNFLVHSWAAWVIHHLELRAANLFPAIEAVLLKPVAGHRHDQPLQQTSGGQHAQPAPQLTVVSDLVHEQSLFVPTLHKVLATAEAAHLHPETYNPAEFVSLLVSSNLGEAMQAHMYRQVHTVFLDTIYALSGTAGSIAAQVTGERLLACWQATDAASSQVMDRFVVPPMMVRCRDVTYESGHDWPGLPVPSVHAIADRLSLPHKGAWRFLPCNVWGRPMELHALVVAHQQGVEMDRHAGLVDAKGKGKAHAAPDDLGVPQSVIDQVTVQEEASAP